MTPISQVPAVPPKLPPHVKLVRNKAGRPYLYLMRHRGTVRAEKPIRLPDDPASPEFWAAYAEAMRLPAPKVRTDTVRALDEAWASSPEWRSMKPRTQVEWSRHRSRIVEAWGDLQVKGIEPKHVLAMRDAWADWPATANNLMRCLSSMMSWSVPRGWRADNPCREVRPLKAGDGYEPWGWDMIETARERLREDLWWSVALALYTGQRQGDVLAMRWDAIQGGMIAVRQGKTGKRLAIPLHRDLRPVLDGIPRRAVTILTSSEGRPWTVTGFRASWRKSAIAADLASRKLVFHGLRKSAVVMLLEAGCTDAEVGAITGQSREMVEHYAKQVNQGRLAATAILKWEQSR